jgi:metal-sulfur cluster biosynthetic enzyme
MITENQVLECLRPIKDPEVHISIVDLGLIYGVDVQNEGKKLNVRMTLTSPMCPAGPEIVAMVKATAELIPNVEEAAVQMVWEPPWDPKKMASDDAKDMLGIW